MKEGGNAPADAAQEAACARSILRTLARRAFRQPVTDGDLATLMQFYDTGRKQGRFDAGIEGALARILIDPRFIFRFEREPASVPAGRPYRISDLELASRLSFFLWSSIPDEELLVAAEKDAPHDVSVFQMSDDDIYLACEEVAELLRKVKVCRQTEVWHGRYLEEQALLLPAWVTMDDEEDPEALDLVLGEK